MVGPPLHAPEERLVMRLAPSQVPVGSREASAVLAGELSGSFLAQLVLVVDDKDNQLVRS